MLVDRERNDVPVEDLGDRGDEDLQVAQAHPQPSRRVRLARRRRLLVEQAITVDAIDRVSAHAPRFAAAGSTWKASAFFTPIIVKKASWKASAMSNASRRPSLK